MSTNASPISIVQAAERYIKGQVRLNIATREAACEAQMNNLSALFREASSISQSDCSELFEYLEGDADTFSKEQRAKLAQLAQTRCDALMSQGSASDHSQTNLYVNNYYPEWLWSVILSPDEHINNKIIHTAGFGVKHLGLKFPCEQTKRLGIAILHEAAKLEKNPQVGYTHVHDLQDAIVAQRRADIPGDMALKNFPKDPHKFWQQYPTSYSDAHPPIACRINETALLHRNNKEWIPVRDSYHKVKGSRSDKNKPIENKADIKDMMLQYMLGKQVARHHSGNRFETVVPSSNCLRRVAPRRSSANHVILIKRSSKRSISPHHQRMSVACHFQVFSNLSPSQRVRLKQCQRFVKT